MPGYYLHFAACNPRALENRSFVLGVEAPDILKKYFKMYGLEGTKEKYNRLKTEEMPEFKALAKRICQVERSGSTEGLHYGVSSNPDIRSFWNSLSGEEKNNPFYKGYLWHLLTDLLMYTRLNIDAKFADFIEAHKQDDNLEELKKEEVEKLHNDWNKINAKVCQEYPDVSLTKEVEELGVVQFSKEGSLQYVNWSIIKEIVDFLRYFDFLNGNQDNIIRVVMSQAKFK